MRGGDKLAIMTDSAASIAEHIVDEAQLALGSSIRVRLYFPGGPVEPSSIEYSQTKRYVYLGLADGGRITVATAAIAGWQELDEPIEEQ